MNEKDINIDLWAEIFNSNVRFRILQLLLVYDEMSLTAISKYMKKSKPALYHHLQIMINLGIVEVSREKKIRGSIYSKFFTLNKEKALEIQQFAERDFSDIENSKFPLKSFKSLIGSYNKSISLFKKKISLIELYLAFLEKETKSWENFKTPELKSLISNYNIGFHSQYLTETQYSKFLDLYKEFYSKFFQEIQLDQLERTTSWFCRETFRYQS